MIATISSVTRESAQNVGNSLKSLLSRYTSIKAKGFNEEDATKINDVTKALTAVGIQSVDAQGQLLNFDQVLDNLGAKWAELTKNEKAYISTAMAGVYQRNRFIVLMDNYSKYTENYAMALNSAGVAEQKFNIYQESTQAHLDKMNASWQELAQNLIESDLVKSIIDLAGASSKAIPWIVGLTVALVAMVKIYKTDLTGTTLLSFFVQIPGLATKAIAAINGVKLAFAALSTVGIMLVITALGVLINEFVKFFQHQQKIRQETENYEDSLAKLNTQLGKTTISVEELDEAFTNFGNNSKTRVQTIEEEVANLVKTLDKAGYTFNKNKLEKGILSYSVPTGSSDLTSVDNPYSQYFNELQALMKEWNEIRKESIIKEEAYADALAMTRWSYENLEPIVEDNSKITEDEQKAIDDLTGSVDKQVSSMSSMAQLYDQINEGGKISTETLIELLRNYPEYNQQIMSAIGNKESELNLTELLFNLNKQRAIAENNALIDEIKKSADLTDLKIAQIEANKILLTQALASGQLDQNSVSIIQSILGSEPYKAVDQIKAIVASSKALKDINIENWTSSNKAEKEKKETEKSLNDILTKKAWHEARIAEAELKGKDAQIEALENYQNYLRAVEKTKEGKKFIDELDKEIADIEGEQRSLQEDINKELEERKEKVKELQEELADLNKENEDFLTSIADKATEEVIKGLNKEKDALEKNKKAEEDKIDLKIQGIEDAISAQQDLNDAQKEEEERQERINNLLKAREKLANILKERNTKLLTENGWEWVANPKDVRDATEEVQSIEKDNAQWEADLRRQKAIKALEDSRQYWEDQKEIVDKFYNDQISLIDDTINSIENIEATGYTERLAALDGFIANWNAKVAAMARPTGLNPEIATTGPTTSNVATSGAAVDYAVKNKDIIDEANKVISDAQKAWAAAKAIGDTTAMNQAHMTAEAARKLVIGSSYTGSASGVSGATTSTGLLVRDSGGLVPSGKLTKNLSGHSEVYLSNNQAANLYNFIKSLPQLSPSGSSSSGGMGGYNFNGPIYVTANNADQFMESMRNYTRLTRK